MEVNGYYIINFIRPGGPVSKTEIRIGDTLISCNSYPLTEWFSAYHGQRAGDTLIFGILRNSKETGIPVIVDSKMSVSPGLYWSVYIIFLLFSISSLYLLYNKKKDKTAELFFIYIQLSVVAVNAANLPVSSFWSVFANLTYIFSTCLLGPILIHFHLLFPRPVKQFHRIKMIPLLFYSLGILIFVLASVIYYLDINPISSLKLYYGIVERVALSWITLTFILALATVIYQFLTIKSTLSRNQLLIVITGSFFGFLTPIFHGLFYKNVTYLMSEYQSLRPLSQAIGSFIMICCILIAIFRYRIWDIEVFIRKALLYLGATLMIIITYLLLIWIVDRLIVTETNLMRFLILSASVIVFLVLRDRIQRMIDRLFHREIYDSATVVSNFEAKLAGIYQSDELKQRIVQSIDEIFHFKSFVLNLKKNGLIYEPAFGYGINDGPIKKEYEITSELEEKLRKSKIFSPEELDKQPLVPEISKGELIVPMVSDNKPNGFFVCGPKKSERIYSHQDIRVLSLLARRVIALLHTGTLYQKDLDRQLMLERERIRISQDMHDDVGASLTRISILSELAKNRGEIDEETKQWLEQITSTSRGVIEEMSQIIWALNPKNDTLEGLIAYIRRFATEYLEPTNVHCSIELPDILPNLPLSVEVRRNIYLVVREALHNLVKHSGATQVNISLIMNKHGFNIIIKDDGKGFDPDNMKFPGNGLVNMKKRMNEIGGEFLVSSKVNNGTEISIFVEI
jgi:signal transduction histidine kinase